jgi:hypothetical protein
MLKRNLFFVSLLVLYVIEVVMESECLFYLSQLL